MVTLSTTQIRYLCAGIWNTAFGYAIGIVVFKLFNDYSKIILIGITSNVISISMSFIVYKIFVFRTDGNWLSEYLRCYVIYGGTSVISVFVLWVTVSKMSLNIYMAQAIAILCSVIISYLGHKKYTFRGVN
jgi:putative flippase GtrA